MPGAGEHIPVGYLYIIAAFQDKKLFVHAICKVNLGSAVEKCRLECRENYVQSLEPRTGNLGGEGMPVFIIVQSLQ